MNGMVHEVSAALRLLWTLIPWLEGVIYPDEKFRTEVRVEPRHEAGLVPLRLGMYYNIPQVTVNLTLQNLSAYSVVLERLALKIDAVDAVWYGTERAYGNQPAPHFMDSFIWNLTAEEHARLVSLTDKGNAVQVQGAAFVRGGRRTLRVTIAFAAKITPAP